MKTEILIIEDNLFDITLLIENLQGYYYTILTTGIIAQDYFKSIEHSLPRLIILDINLPGIHGIELLKQIRSNPIYDNVKVVVLTCSTNPADKEECLKLGANRYIEKPFTIPALRVTMAEINGEIPLNG